MSEPSKKPVQPQAQSSLPIVLRIANAMHKLAVAGLPRNYEVFYDAVSGANPELQKEFWSLGKKPTQQQLDELYSKYCARGDEHTLAERIRGALETQVYETMDLVKQEQSSVSNYGRILGQASESVDPAEDMSSQVLSRILTVLSNATDTTRTRSSGILTSMAKKAGELEEIKTELEEYKRLAETDALTGIWNRRAFERRLHDHFAGSRRTAALLVIDIDKFKALNDTYGHPFGDRVINGVASAIRAKLRDDSFFARTGGEEFAVIVENAETPSALAVAERVRSAVEESIFSDGRVKLAAGAVTVSVGACLSRQADDGNDLYSKADEALYESKRSGRNRVSVYEGVSMSPGRKNLYLYR